MDIDMDPLENMCVDMESVEGCALDLALDSLDMLSTVTAARRDYLNELKARGIRPLPSIRT